MGNQKNFTEIEIKTAIKNGITMGGSAAYLECDWRTFKKNAEKYGLYSPKSSGGLPYDLEDILNGKHPQYPTYHLSKRLVKSGIKEYICEECDISEYNNKPISLELDHIDGVSSNHNLKNLRLLCPNCHSQTDTYRSKKLRKVPG